MSHKRLCSFEMNAYGHDSQHKTAAQIFVVLFLGNEVMGEFIAGVTQATIIK